MYRHRQILLHGMLWHVMPVSVWQSVRTMLHQPITLKVLMAHNFGRRIKNYFLLITRGYAEESLHHQFEVVLRETFWVD